MIDKAQGLTLPGEPVDLGKDSAQLDTIRCTNAFRIVPDYSTGYHSTVASNQSRCDPVLSPLNPGLIYQRGEGDNAVLDCAVRHPTSFNANISNILEVGTAVVGIVGNFRNRSHLINNGYYKIYLSETSVIGYLHYLSFNGASKKSRPELKYGDVVYCIVKQVPTEANLTRVESDKGGFLSQLSNVIELTCISDTNTKDWTTSEYLYGLLNRNETSSIHTSKQSSPIPGVLLKFNCHVSKQLFDDQYNHYLSFLGGIVSFELTIGLNGYSYLKILNMQKSMQDKQILKSYVAVQRCLLLIPKLPYDQWMKYVTAVFNVQDP